MTEPKQYKIVMLGSGAVGKSAITVQLVSGHFLESYDPTIEDSYRTTIIVNNEGVVLNILDTAGQEEFSALRDQYMRSGDGYIIVFSITSALSFLEVNTFKEQLYRVLDLDNSEFIPMVLVGNKCDLKHERQVQSIDAQRLADEWKIKYIEVSAKNKTNIYELFEELVNLIEMNIKNININDLIHNTQIRYNNSCCKLF